MKRLTRLPVSSLFVALWISPAAISFAQTGVEQSPDEPLSSTQSVTQTLSSGPIVIAHRGASGYLPEHTTEAAALAHAMNVDFIEQDVVLSKDGVPVVLHDVTLQGVTNVADVFPNRSSQGNFFVFDFTLEELRQLNVMERRKGDIRFPRGSGTFRIATLEEHLQLIQGLNHSRGKQTGVYVELKKPAQHRTRGLELSETVLKVLTEFGYVDSDDNIFLQCFEEDEVKRLRTELQCRLKLIQLYSKRPTAEQLSEIAKYADGIGINIEALVSAPGDSEEQGTVANSFTREAHDAALQVHAWTFRTDQLPKWVATPEDLLSFLFNEAHVDGVFADQPDAALKYLKDTHNVRAARGPFHLLNSDGGPKKAKP